MVEIDINVPELPVRLPCQSFERVLGIDQDKGKKRTRNNGTFPFQPISYLRDAKFHRGPEIRRILFSVNNPE